MLTNLLAVDNNTPENVPSRKVSKDQNESDPKKSCRSVLAVSNKSNELPILLSIPEVNRSRFDILKDVDYDEGLFDSCYEKSGKSIAADLDKDVNIKGPEEIVSTELINSKKDVLEISDTDEKQININYCKEVEKKIEDDFESLSVHSEKGSKKSFGDQDEIAEVDEFSKNADDNLQQIDKDNPREYGKTFHVISLKKTRFFDTISSQNPDINRGFC